ncbi:pyridoxal kinase-like [Mercenaria mercenaria]|uniref:pyridoxal kinase-like n=1 Tax=Mercenaria mercenaria TaxID=6596 RepID=UPI00234F85F7|nr:pyridoxal kinase-like [Mercenaria mercenaria]
MSALQQNQVLSIQSTVVSGYVGNKCASFALQIHGFDVCPVNSVQLSNHTGYKCFKGQVLNAEDIECLYDGLKQNNIHGQFSHLITGYIGSKSFLLKVGEIIQDIRDSNPGIMYVCDPVMGDNGKMYVPEELMPVYRDVIVPKADIVTPNQFEAELLTGIKITSEAEALKAMQCLHDKGPKTVVLSSTNLGLKDSKDSKGSEDVLVALASSVKNGDKECYRIEMPYKEAIFVGTGDLFASCLMAWMHKDNDLKTAFEKTVSTVQTVITRTLNAAQEVAGPGNKPTPAQMELRLIQSKSDIENPKINFTAKKL